MSSFIDENGKITTKKFFDTNKNMKEMDGKYTITPLAALKEELENVIFIFINFKKQETKVVRVK